ncbi:TonB-dependent receptor [Litorivivens sp.]|uniref:TonB-dependent receptor n=1 Tax=Litorivivens sp. TaxID=2020868 RepID=UPI00356583D7
MIKESTTLTVLCLIAAAAASAKQPDSNERIDEIIVTAQKRSESVQDVPLSVSVLGGERISNAAIHSFEDVSQVTPNTDINMTAGYVQVGVRGVNAPINDGMEQSVGFYIDGIYYAKTDFLQDAFLDLDRVEVLKGPQGTLFGKNTIAGAINVTSASPVNTFEASVGYRGGELSTRQLTAMLNLPLLEDRVAFRLAGTTLERDGYVYNTLRHEDEKRVDKSGLRTRMLWEVSNQLSATLTYYEGHAADSGQGWEPFILEDDAQAIHGAFDKSLEAEFDYQSHANSDNRNDVATYVTNLDIRWDIADFQLSFLGSHAESRSDLFLDADTASAPIAEWLRQFTYRQNMLEARLDSGPGRLEYLIGFFGFWSDNKQAGDLRMLPEGPLVSVLGPLLGVENSFTGSEFSGIDAFLNATTTDALIQQYHLSTITKALFSQVTWHLNERLSLVVGLRASQESKSVYLDQDYESTGILLQSAFGVTEYTLDGRRDESNIAPKIAGKYAVGDDDMVYVTLAQGFKAGGFNPLAREADEASFDQEYAQSYEVGYKLTALQGALTANTAIYRTEYDDMQIQAFIGNGFLVSNAAEATTQGLEFDLLYQPRLGTSLYANIGVSDARFNRFPDGPCPATSEHETCDLSGEMLPRSSKYSANLGGSIAYPLLNNRIAAFLGVDWSWRSDILFDLDQDPLDSQDQYHLINLHIGVLDTGNAWKFLVHVKNLEDRKVRQFAADMPVFNGSHMGFLHPPRIVSAEFIYRF